MKIDMKEEKEYSKRRRKYDKNFFKSFHVVVKLRGDSTIIFHITFLLHFFWSYGRKIQLGQEPEPE